MNKTLGFLFKINLLLLANFLGSSTLMAEPAYWFQWESKFNGKMICKQLSPGEGWQKHAGPFYDAQCKKPVPGINGGANQWGQSH